MKLGDAMCGRFTLYADPDFLEDYFDLENGHNLEVEPRYNIAPTQPILSIVQGKKGLRAGYMKWGLIPHWAKDESFSSKMINARSETLHEKRSFKGLLGKRHCVIVANGFFEWKKTDVGKQPYYIKNKNDDLLIFAGLWDRWVNKENGEQIVSCTVLTTEANEMMRDLHHRMPVILDKGKCNWWLQQANWTEDLLEEEFFKPFPSEKMMTFPVNKVVNSPKHDSVECIKELI
ncbi:putative SOS response-associated peptidase YedK [Evansella vedderi]|uniref:Abasic site processing protein n=1 Tax=Evansella vedderi TaxID=38282 RepID=A0ABT9ZW50_9BACI|nr:SOS response-associated peptidase [Evansella vedderi]MDQ0255185.1 putative SOS response-associated peptidase YedK [Evansella vedderi]